MAQLKKLEENIRRLQEDMLHVVEARLVDHERKLKKHIIDQRLFKEKAMHSMSDQKYKQYKRYDDKIIKAVKAVGVDETDVCDVLKLVNEGVLMETLCCCERMETIEAKSNDLIGSCEWIEDYCDYSLSIASVFTGRLQRIVPHLEQRDYNKMNDILCDEKNELDQIVQNIETDLKKANDKPLSKPVKRKIKKMCMREYAEAGWMQAQEQKAEIIRKQLLDWSPIFIDFFDEFIIVLNDIIPTLLEFGTTYNNAQQKAIKMRKENATRLKTMLTNADDDMMRMLEEILEEQNVEKTEEVPEMEKAKSKLRNDSRALQVAINNIFCYIAAQLLFVSFTTLQK
eukprot:64529_1